MPNSIKIALLDMNDGQPNLGIKNLLELTQEFIDRYGNGISYQLFDVRSKCQFPKFEDFDVYISSGGPGNPHFVGLEWEEKFVKLLDQIKNHNKENNRKKYLFLICHSFQMAVIHWEIAKVLERESYSFGVMPIYKTDAGMDEPLFQNLDQPFYAVDSREFQCVYPNLQKMKKMNMNVLAIENSRDHQSLSRALMAIRFSEEIIGTQFHPEANPEDVMCNLIDEKYKAVLIQRIGLENYLNTLELADDEDKIKRTQVEIIPGFLKNALENLMFNSRVNHDIRIQKNI